MTINRFEDTLFYKFFKNRTKAMLKTTIYRIKSDNTEAQASIQQEGACKNQLLIIVREADLNPENRKTLSQMLNAIKYNLEDSCMITLADEQTLSINPYIHQYDIKRAICFGLSPAVIGLQITATAYRLIEMEELKLVFSHTIGDLNADKQKKIKLWNTIQAL